VIAVEVFLVLVLVGVAVMAVKKHLAKGAGRPVKGDAVKSVEEIESHRRPR